MDHSTRRKVALKAEAGTQDEDGPEISFTEIDIDFPDIKEECLERSTLANNCGLSNTKRGDVLDIESQQNWAPSENWSDFSSDNDSEYFPEEYDKRDENPSSTLPETQAMTEPNVPPSVPRKALKRKKAKDSPFSYLQKLVAAKLVKEENRKMEIQDLAEKNKQKIATQIAILQLQREQAVLQCDLLIRQGAQSKLQLEILGKQRIAKAAQSEIQLQILREEGVASEARFKVQMEILEEDRKMRIASEVASEARFKVQNEILEEDRKTRIANIARAKLRQEILDENKAIQSKIEFLAKSKIQLNKQRLDSENKEAI